MSKVLQLKMQLVTQVGMGAAATGRDPGGTDLGFGGDTSTEGFWVIKKG